MSLELLVFLHHFLNVARVREVVNHEVEFIFDVFQLLVDDGVDQPLDFVDVALDTDVLA